MNGTGFWTFLGGILVVLVPYLFKEIVNWLGSKKREKKQQQLVVEQEKKQQQVAEAKAQLEKDDELREIRRRHEEEIDRYRTRFEKKYDELELAKDQIFLERFNLERDKYHLEEELKDKNRYIDELCEEVKAEQRKNTILDGQIIALTGERDSLQTEVRRLSNLVSNLGGEK